MGASSGSGQDLTAFTFEARQMFTPSDGMAGDTTLMGPLLSQDTALTVGDHLEVVIFDGACRLVECVEFPLIDNGHADWVKVSVLGVLPSEVAPGSRATRIGMSDADSPTRGTPSPDRASSIPQIVPSEGFQGVQLGAGRTAIEASIGEPTSTRPGSAFYVDRDPTLILRYAADDTLEMIEIPYSGEGNEPHLGDIQLTARLLADVIDDLLRAGYVGRPCDIGYDFEAGFTVWSMGEIQLFEVDPSADRDDFRDVAEGVSIASPAYFGF